VHVALHNGGMSDVTRILSQIDSGDPSAAQQLLPLVYDELRRLAAAKLAQERPGQTLQATALVHEAYLRLVGQPDGEKERRREGETGQNQHPSVPLSLPPSVPAFHSRSHFFAAAAEAMRRILVDAARRKQCQRHGGELERCDLLDDDVIAVPISDQLLDLDQALTRLAAEDPQAAQMVQLRVFGGMTIDEAAAAAGISPRTADRNWAYARAWLGRELAAYGRENN
jgi:RNA polymerase sigma factor (sigma-70 family)